MHEQPMTRYALEVRNPVSGAWCPAHTAVTDSHLGQLCIALAIYPTHETRVVPVAIKHN
jgi:hypothetical protein